MKLTNFNFTFKGEKLARLLPSIVVLVFGFVTLASALSVNFADRLIVIDRIYGIAISSYARSSLILLGFVLVIVAYNLFLGSRNAWIITFALVIATTLFHVFRAFDSVSILFGFSTISILYLNKQHFKLRGDINSLRRGLTALTLNLFLTFFYGTMGFYFLDKRIYKREFSFSQSIYETFRLFFSTPDKNLIFNNLFSRLFIDSIYLVGLLSVLYALYSIFKPFSYYFTVAHEQKSMADDLRQKYGKDILDYFKTYWDKMFFFSDSKNAFLAYRVSGSVAIVLGDPVAKDKKSFVEIIDQFRIFCSDNGWTQAFMQVEKSNCDFYVSRGMKAIKIGNDAEVDIQGFKLEGAEGKDFRYVLRKLEKEGLEVKFYDKNISGGELQKLRQVSNEWLQTADRQERIFTQGVFFEPDLKSETVVTVENEEGEVLAFISLIQDYKKGAIGLDLIRRRKDIPNGTMEFLITKTILEYQKRGYSIFNLGLAPLFGLGDSEDSRVLERALGMASKGLDAVFNYKGLGEFKEKFKPKWEPRYLIYENEYQLPLVVIALTKVINPKGFESFLKKAVGQSLKENYKK